MIKMIEKMNVRFCGPNDAKVLNAAYAEGYRFMCNGDYATCDTIDPWSGMPDVTENAYFFDSREEAEAFAAKQVWPFNPNVHAEVYKVPEHSKDWAELEAEEAAKKAKKEATEARKATEMGLTVEEYKRKKKNEALLRSLEKEIAAMETELARKKALYEKRKNEG